MGAPSRRPFTCADRVTRGVKTHPQNLYKTSESGHMLGEGGLLPDGSTIDPMHLLLAPFQLASSPELQNGIWNMPNYQQRDGVQQCTTDMADISV